jgi:hypothetical protein
VMRRTEKDEIKTRRRFPPALRRRFEDKGFDAIGHEDGVHALEKGWAMCIRGAGGVRTYH